MPGDPTYYYNRQLAYVVVGIGGLLVLSLVPPRLMRRMHPLLYVFVVLSTAVVLAVGTSVQGGQRWINLGVVPVPALGAGQAAADRGPGGAAGAQARRVGAGHG